MEYTDDYSGRTMPCPACQQAITIPGVAPAMMKSSLRLERDIPKPARKPRWTFLAILGALRNFINRKGVSLFLLAFLCIGGAMLGL